MKCGHSRILHTKGVGCFGIDGIPDEDKHKVDVAMLYRSVPTCDCKQFDPPCHYTDAEIHEKVCKKPEWVRTPKTPVIKEVIE